MIGLILLVLFVALVVALLTRRIDPVTALVILAVILVAAYFLAGAEVHVR